MILINKDVKVQEIREYLSIMGLLDDNCRDAARNFIKSNGIVYKVMLTLTLKQAWYDKNGKMRVNHYLSVEDIPRICERFEHKLNRLIWKSRYTRHRNEKLSILKAWEDGHGTKRKHVHALIGNFPVDFRFSTLKPLIEIAAGQCYEIDTEYDVRLCDTDAVDYITKEVGKRNTDKILW